MPDGTRNILLLAAKWRLLKQRDMDHYERLKAGGRFH